MLLGPQSHTQEVLWRATHRLHYLICSFPHSSYFLPASVWKYLTDVEDPSLVSAGSWLLWGHSVGPFHELVDVEVASAVLKHPFDSFLHRFSFSWETPSYFSYCELCVLTHPLTSVVYFLNPDFGTFFHFFSHPRVDPRGHSTRMTHTAVDHASPSHAGLALVGS